jgi:GTP-binding protein EngB required for normal cell division
MFKKFLDERQRLSAQLTRVAKAQSDGGQRTLAAATTQTASDLLDFRFRIGVLGGMKRGKSTLINVLLGRSDDALAPIAAEPATGVITEFEDSGADGPLVIRVVSEGSGAEEREISAEQIAEYATEQGNPGNNRGVAVIQVKGRFPLLHHSAVLVDTPGNGSVYQEHSKASIAALRYCDAYILLVSATIPLDRVELEYLRAMGERERRQLIVVLSKSDMLAAGEREEVLKRIRAKLSEANLQPRTILEVSAKKVFEATKRALDVPLLDAMRRECGITALEKAIEIVAESESIHLEALRSKIGDAVGDAENYLSRESERVEADLASSSSDLGALEKRKAAEQDGMKAAVKAFESEKKRFALQWQALAVQFVTTIQSCGDQVEADLEDWLEGQRGVMGAHRGASSLAVEVSRRVSTVLAPEVLKLQNRSNELVERLKIESMNAIDLVAPRKRRGASSALEGVAAPVTAGIAGVALFATLASQATAITAVGGVTPATTGFVACCWQCLAGKAAATAAPTAFGAAVMSGIVMVSGVTVAALVAVKVAEAVVRGNAKGRIGHLVRQSIDAVIADIVGADHASGAVGDARDRLLQDHSARMSETLEGMAHGLEVLRAQILERDPELVPQLEARMKLLEDLRVDLGKSAAPWPRRGTAS